MRLAKFGSAQASRCLWAVWYGLTLLTSSACSFPNYHFVGSNQEQPDACAGPDCVAPCPIGYADCNGVSDDGCETALGSATDCSGCGVDCTNAHGLTHCVSAGDAGLSCQPTCVAGYADCDLNPGNGCETDINSDSIHCGACDKACSGNGGTPLCQGGQCGVSSCNDGFGDCTNAGSCSFNLNTDPSNCGHCGHICSSAHGKPFCNGGMCQITCDSDYGDCNAQMGAGAWVPDDGCETKLNVPDSMGSVPNCGACATPCVRRAYTMVNLEQCALGVCARDCFTDQGDCDDNRNDPECAGSGCGCESYLGNNSANCGACGHRCLGGACFNDVCQCPDSKPASGKASCNLPSSVSCGPYDNDCRCNCKSGVFQCVDKTGKSC